MIKITESPDIKRWGEFVYNHPKGNIFQTPEMAEVYRSTERYKPITLAAIDNDNIIAILLAVAIKEIRGILGTFSARSIIQGGPLFVENEMGFKAVSLLMEEYDKIAKKYVLYTEIRNVYDVSRFKLLFEKLGYKFEDHLNFLIDLNKPKEEIWRQIHRSMRKNIKKRREMA